MRRAKQLLSLLLKTAVAVALVYWLLASDRLQVEAFAGIPINGRTVSLVVLSALAVFVGQLLLAIRLQILLAGGGLRVAMGRILGLTMIGSFTGIALPGLVGGDVVKAAYLCGDAPGRRACALAAVIVDRIIGFYSLFFMGAIALGIGCISGVITAWNPWLLIPLAAVLCTTLGIALLPLGPWLVRFRLMRTLWEFCPEKIRHLSDAVGACLGQWHILTAAVVLSIANHALVITTFVAAGLLLADPLPPLLHFVLSPLATVWNMIGLTPGGVGLTESAFSFVYEMHGSHHGAAIGLLGRGIQYLTFIVGGVVAMSIVRMRPRAVLDP